MPRLLGGQALGVCLLQALAEASWVPRPLRHYEAGSAAEGSAPGVQRFTHRELREFKDGSNTELLWEVDADPDTILALDVEHEHGASVLECWSDQLVLKVPTGHAARASQWRHVTASEIRHGCRHLVGRNMYHRVLRVEDVRPLEGSPGSAAVVLATKELASPSEVFPHVRFSLRHVPAAAREYAKEPAPELPRTGGHSAWMATPRRASVFTGNPKVESHFTPDTSHINSILHNVNAPEQDSNLAWAWDYDANSTRNPQYRYVFPGGVGYMRLYKPYLKSHFALTVNFTSQFTDLLRRPEVHVVALLQGFADLNADIATAVNFQEDKSASVLENILDSLELPGFPSFKLSKFKFKPMKFSMGGTPMTVTLGYRCGMKAYHLGLLQGSLRVGLATKLHMNGIMSLSMQEGLKSNISAEALDVKFTPPTWMLFTQRFELGVILEPEFYVKGAWGDMPDMQLGLGFRPYLNVSISQQRAPGEPGSNMKLLAIFPFRALGLPLGKNYAVKIGANGEMKQTQSQTSTGIIEYKDNVQGFSFGVMSESDLVANPIEVAIMEEGKDQPVASGKAVCTSVVSGVCHPAPVAKMQVDGKDVYVQLTARWQDNALGVLESSVRGLTIRYPQITINSKDLATKLENPVAIDGVELRIVRNGRKFSVPLQTRMNSNILYESLVYFELGPSFLDAWKYADEQKVDSASAAALKPKVELLVLGEVVGTGVLPPVNWDQQASTGSSMSSLQSLFKTQLAAVPLMVPLYDPKQPSVMVGTAEIELDAGPAQLGAFFLSPSKAEVLPQGQPYKVSWTIHGAVEDVKYNFTLTAFTVGPNGGFVPTVWRKPVEVGCSKKSGVPSGRYYGDIRPCVFQFEVQPPAELAGQRIVFVARWLDADYNPHEMVSEPVTITKGGSRRLGKWELTKLADHEGLSAEVKDNLAQLRAKCSAHPLRYRVNAGVNFIERMKNVFMPLAMTMGSSYDGYEGMGSANEWTSEPIPVFKLGVGQHRKKLSELLPRSICAGGVCDGMMPGCQKTRMNPIDIKQIVFKLSRKFDVQKHLSPTMRHAVAYGLAILPSAIKIGEREIEQELAKEKAEHEAMEAEKAKRKAEEEEEEDEEEPSAPVPSPAAEAAVASPGSSSPTTSRRPRTRKTSTTPQPPTPEEEEADFEEDDFLPPSDEPTTTKRAQAPTPSPTRPWTTQRPSPSPSSTKASSREGYLDIFDDKSARRLSAEEEHDLVEDGLGGLRPLTPEEVARLRTVDGDDDDEDEEVAPFDRFVVRITQPMHYELTEELMHTLIKRNAFRFEDGHEATRGPIFVKAFELRDPPSVGPATHDAVATALAASVSGSEQLAPGISVRAARCAVGAAAGMAAILAVVFAAAAARRQGYVAVAPTDLALHETREFA